MIVTSGAGHDDRVLLSGVHEVGSACCCCTPASTSTYLPLCCQSGRQPPYHCLRNKGDPLQPLSRQVSEHTNYTSGVQHKTPGGLGQAANVVPLAPISYVQLLNMVTGFSKLPSDAPRGMLSNSNVTFRYSCGFLLLVGDVYKVLDFCQQPSTKTAIPC
jgi:hypothetical protein